MKRSLLPLLGTVSTALAGLSASALAAGEIEEIIVTAAPLNRSADELTQATLVLETDALLRRAANSIGETLANELGMSTSYFGPVAGRPVIRGQEGSRVTVLDGGISTLDAADISPDHAVPIEPLFAERIEVIRGPGTLLYGSSAAGGVVNVIDGRIPERQVERPISGAVELRGESATEERAVAARLDGGVGALSWHLDGFDRQTEDIEIKGYATADADERPEDEARGRALNTEGDSHGFAAGASWIGEQGFLGASVSRHEATYGLPGHGAHEHGHDDEHEAEHDDDHEEEDDHDHGAEALIAPGPFIVLEQTRVDVHGVWNVGGFVDSLRFRAAHNDYEHQEIEPTGEVATTFENDAWEARLEALHAEVAGWTGALGIQMTDRDFSAVGAEAFVPPTRSKSWGVFLLEELDLGGGRLEFGGRVERTEHDPDGGLAKFEQTAISVAAGINWDLAEGYHMSANLSRSERNPNLEELYSNGAHLATGLFEVGLLAQEDGDVDEEVAINLDAGLHYHAEAMSWQVAVFYNDIADYVFRFETGLEEDGLPLTPYRQEDAKFFGVEGEFAMLFGDGWDIRFFGDYVRGKTGGDDLPRIPPLRLGAQLGFSREAWSAGVEAIWHAEQNDVSSFRTDSFTLLNAHVTFAVDSGGPLQAEVFLKGTNLLDEAARRSTSFLAADVPLPGAGVQFGVRARFN